MPGSDCCRFVDPISIISLTSCWSWCLDDLSSRGEVVTKGIMLWRQWSESRCRSPPWGDIWSHVIRQVVKKVWPATAHYTSSLILQWWPVLKNLLLIWPFPSDARSADPHNPLDRSLIFTTILTFKGISKVIYGQAQRSKAETKLAKRLLSQLCNSWDVRNHTSTELLSSIDKAGVICS
jgi:hypothetical protein